MSVGTGCRAFHLESLANDRAARTLIEPFDRIRAVPAAVAFRAVSRRAWMHRLREVVASTVLADVPGEAARANIALLGHQIAPALPVLTGVAARLLVADHVGLGKTIQAGLLVSELAARGEAQRVLVVTPAGLRDQWRSELWNRFGLAATVCDTPWLAQQAAALPPGTNPWTLSGIRLVSIDLVKRPEVLNGLDELVWDVLVVDEAHLATAGSDRGTAIDAIARRARRVVLVTATPHDGSAARFEALCDVGRLGRDDNLLVFRRTKDEFGLRVDRRTRLLRVRPSAAEQRMHELLAGYARAIRRATPDQGRHGARLALSVLVKRSLSSARALELTAWRRRQLLWPSSGGLPPVQPVLPLVDAGEGPTDDECSPPWLGVPGLHDVRLELAWLGAIVEAARRAARTDRKLAAISRLLARTREPVIVFTEFRDSLTAVARCLVSAQVAALHGGHGDDERRRSLDAFSRGERRILLATDAASEGLNLHDRCRWVISLELPWTPNRLEQRVGRVDRLGQLRAVHAMYFVARGTAEEALWSRLTARWSVIRAAVDASPRAEHGTPDGVCLDEALDLAGATSCDSADEAIGGRPAVEAGDGHRGWRHFDGRDEADAALEHLALLRRLASTPTRKRPLRLRRSGRPRLRVSRPVFTRLHVRARPWCRRESLLVLFRVTLASMVNGPVEVRLMPLLVELDDADWPDGRSPNVLASKILTRRSSTLAGIVERAFESRRREVEALVARRSTLDRARLDAIERDRRHRLASVLIQPGLFDAPFRAAPDTSIEERSGGGPSEQTALTVRYQVVLAATLRIRG